MSSIFILTIDGDVYHFYDNNFTVEQRIAIQSIAQEITNDLSTHSFQSNCDSCTLFIDKVNTQMCLLLEPLDVSMVVRISCNSLIK